MIGVDQVNAWLKVREGEDLEFKEARRSYSFDKLVEYCVAMANMGGGRIILGATDRRPRRVVGTAAFSQIERLQGGLRDKLRLKIEVEECPHPSGRVLVVTVPAHPLGVPMQVDGRYMERDGDNLVPLSVERLRSILDESGADYSAGVCPDASMDDLDRRAIERFRRRWQAKASSAGIARLGVRQLLRDAEAVVDGGVTYAALIVFGTRAALRKHLQRAETIYEYRSSEAAGPAQQRIEYQQGFFSFYDSLWKTINLRNDVQHYQDGLFVLDIPTFDERSVREAVLNAVTHRDYRLGGSIFFRQYARHLVVESPGGFPPGITPENILDRQNPRNRLIAEIFAKCGLVERSGQGMNLMFEESIQHGKTPPDFGGTDEWQVTLTMDGRMNDPSFVRFLGRIGSERGVSFSTQDLILLDIVNRGQPVPAVLRPRLGHLVDAGALEVVGRGRGARYILSRGYYSSAGRKGAYTRKRGLSRETNKALLLQHIKENEVAGSKMAEFREVLPSNSRSQIQVYLRELARNGKIHSHGTTNAARWYTGPGGSNCNHGRK